MAKITAADVRAALKRRYAQPEYGLVYEVAQSTGHGANRHLDALAMDLWPSRGLTLHGIEIKVDLYDWRREKANPEKAEEIARFCDFFWIAAPTGLIPMAELPSAWGLLEVDEQGAIAQTKNATRTDAAPVSRPFLAAVFRAASRPVDPGTLDSLLKVHRERISRENDELIKREAERLAGVRSEAAKSWQELLEALGEEPQRFYEDTDVIRAVKAIRKAGVAHSWRGLTGLEKTLTDAVDRLREAIKEFGIEDPLARPAKRRKRS